MTTAPKEEVISATDLQVRLGQVVGRAEFAGGRTIVTRRGREAAAIIGMTDLERLRELDRHEPTQPRRVPARR